MDSDLEIIDLCELSDSEKERQIQSLARFEQEAKDAQLARSLQASFTPDIEVIDLVQDENWKNVQKKQIQQDERLARHLQDGNALMVDNEPMVIEDSLDIRPIKTFGKENWIDTKIIPQPKIYGTQPNLKNQASNHSKYPTAKNDFLNQT